MAQTVTRWWWIRHAPVIGANGRIYGQDDLEADCSNAALFGQLAVILPNPAVWLVTHLRRTQQTATAIAASAAWALPELLTAPELAEQHFGDWQGLTHAELDAQRDGAYHRFWHAPADHRPPNGESFRDVVERVERAIGQYTATHGGQDIIAVAHGGTIRAALAIALGIDPERALGFNIDNCSITRMDHIDGVSEGANWRIVAVNQHPDALLRL